jgi:hypothetical protein
MTITDDDVQKAIDWLRDTALKAAKARAEREYLSEFRKVLKAQIMRENKTESIGAQEAIAYADNRYIAHLDCIRTAIEVDEHLRFLRVAAEAKVEAWRTMSSNERAGIIR